MDLRAVFDKITKSGMLNPLGLIVWSVLEKIKQLMYAYIHIIHIHIFIYGLQTESDLDTKYIYTSFFLNIVTIEKLVINRASF